MVGRWGRQCRFGDEVSALLEIHVGDVREQLAEMPDESVHCVVTSPPYWGLRDYGVAGQLGLEATPEEHVAAIRPPSPRSRTAGARC